MSGYDWDGSIYDDVDAEARHDWLRERPDVDEHDDAEMPWEHRFSIKQWRQENGRPEPRNLFDDEEPSPEHVPSSKGTAAARLAAPIVTVRVDEWSDVA